MQLVLIIALALPGATNDADETLSQAMHQAWGQQQATTLGEQLRQRFGHRERWRRQAHTMLQQCAGDQACSPELAQAALQVMHQASQQADRDPRRTGKQLTAAMRHQYQKQAGDGTGEQHQYRHQHRNNQDGAGADAAAQSQQRNKQGEAAQLQEQQGEAARVRLKQQKKLQQQAVAQLAQRLRTRLRLQQQTSAASQAGTIQQKRHQYRRKGDGEQRRGGKFGGSESSRPGMGLSDSAPGDKPGPGGR